MIKLKGIDVSHHQGLINWKKVSDAGIDFAILRVGFSKRADKHFLTNVKGCIDNGIPIQGIYLFSYALDVKNSIKEAEFAVSMLEKSNLPMSTIVFFDLEYDSVKYAKKQGVTIGYKECNAHTKAFCDRIIDLGYPAGVYFNLQYYKTMYDHKILKDYEQWLAFWSNKPLPVDVNYHQYSDEGSVPGIYGDVDMNYIFVEEEESNVPIQLLTTEEIVMQVFDGVWGNGDDRIDKLTNAGYDAGAIQTYINKVNKVAKECIDGIHGNGEDRILAMSRMQLSYKVVQYVINLNMK